MAAEPTRRAAIAAAAAVLPLLAAGCTRLRALAAPPRPASDVALLRQAIVAEELMVARYRAAADGAAGSGLAALLESLLRQHTEHLAALRGLLTIPAGSPYAARYQERRQGRPRARPSVPSARGQLPGLLAAAEQAASARLGRQLLAAPPPLAQLLASISAAEASHVPALTAAGRTG